MTTRKLDKLECAMTEEEFQSLWVQKSLKYCDAQILYSIITQYKPARILELGRFMGLSTKIMASAVRANGLGHITSVDILAPRKDLLLDDADMSVVDLVTDDEVKYLNSSPDNSFDLIFEDTNHATELIKTVVPLLERVVAPGGIVLFHNSDWPTVKEGFKQAGVSHRIHNYMERNKSSIALLLRGKDIK